MTRGEQGTRGCEVAEAEASRIDMQAFDRLPPSYRDVIRNAQIEIPATVARAYLSAFGQRLGLLLLRWAVHWRSRKVVRDAGAGATVFDLTARRRTQR